MKREEIEKKLEPFRLYCEGYWDLAPLPAGEWHTTPMDDIHMTWFCGAVFPKGEPLREELYWTALLKLKESGWLPVGNVKSAISFEDAWEFVIDALLRHALYPHAEYCDRSREQIERAFRGES